jgi:hypothetical protein
MFRESVLKDTVTSYRNLSEYFRDVRALFEFINVRLAIPEYGTRLRPIAGNRLHSNANAYMLYDESEYPFYLWLPSWLGRFYIDPDRVPEGVNIDDFPMSDARFIAWVWPWLGLDDAYVKDSPVPECWVGVAEPQPSDPSQSVVSTAEMIFKHFRIARGSEFGGDGWIEGKFEPNGIGCNLRGRWFVRRTPLSVLNSYYEVEQNVIRPIGERLSSLRAEGDGAHRSGQNLPDMVHAGAG